MRGEREVLRVGELPEDVIAAIEAAEYGVELGLPAAHPGAYREPDDETPDGTVRSRPWLNMRLNEYSVK